MPAWKRWVKYAKAKLDATLRSTNAELDEREAELDAARQGKPWLADDRPSPSYDDVKARIERENPEAARPARSSGNPTFDLAEQERAAAERLEDIRESLGVDDDPKK